MADTPVFLVFATNGEVRALTEAEYLQGFAYLGNMPPTVADFNYMFQLEDQKFLYLKNALENPTWPMITDYIKEQVSTGSHVWVQSQSDGKLHPMTLVDAKRAILESDGEGLFLLEHRMRHAEMQIANMSLALEAQQIYPDYAAMIAEDFQDTNTIDMLQVVVTSVIAGDDSIDVESLIGLQPGSAYTLTDGVAQERVVIKSIAKNGSVNRVVLVSPVVNTYSPSVASLFRTTAFILDSHVYGAGSQQSLVWQVGDAWEGTVANTTTAVPLVTTTANSAAFTASGDIGYTADGAVTLV